MKKTILIWLLLISMAFGAGYGESMVGDSANVTYTGNVVIDTGQAVFYSSAGDSVNAYALTQTAYNDSILELASATHLYGLTAGTYTIVFRMYTGSDSVFDTGMHLRRVAGESELTAEGIASVVADTVGRRLGAGDYACTLLVLETADSTIVVTADITVRPKGGGEPLGKDETSLAGIIIFNFDAADSLEYSPFKSGYSWANIPEYITITGAQTDTIWATEITATAPPADMCTIRFLVNDPSYDTLAGTYLEYQLVDSLGKEIGNTTQITYGTGINTMRVSTKLYTYSSDNSVFELPVFPNSLLSPSWTTYKLRIRFPDGTIALFPYVEVPDTTSWNPFE